MNAFLQKAIAQILPKELFRYDSSVRGIIYIGQGCDVDRTALAGRILKVDGVLLLVVAALHLIATPLALSFISSQLTPESYAEIKPPFLLSFILVGVLLIPVGLSTFYCAKGLERGERWARAICTFNAVSMLMLPLALILIMPGRYFRAILFVISAILVWIIAISMTVPLVVTHSKAESPAEFQD